MPDVASGRIGPPHYHDTFQTCQAWRVGVCMLARCARATRRTHTHHTRVEMHLVACVWEYGVLFFGQVGAWSTTVAWLLSNMPDVASGRMHAGEMCTCQVARTLTTHESRCTLWRVFGSMSCCFLAKLVLGPPHYHDTFQTCQTWRVGVCIHHTTMTPFKRARRGE